MLGLHTSDWRTAENTRGTQELANMDGLHCTAHEGVYWPEICKIRSGQLRGYNVQGSMSATRWLSVAAKLASRLKACLMLVWASGSVGVRDASFRFPNQMLTMLCDLLDSQDRATPIPNEVVRWVAIVNSPVVAES